MKKTKVAGLLVTFLVVVLLAPTIARAGDVKGKVTVQGLKSAENIAVYADAIPGKKFDTPAQHAVIDQRRITFVPHVTVVLQGTTVDFLNSDSVAHNVYWPSIGGNKKLGHNLGTWPQGEKRSFQFTGPGVAALLCNVHPEMSAYLVIVSTPYFAVTDFDGSFTIKNLPQGTYTLKTWSEGGKVTTQSVTVAGGTANVELIVKK